MAGVSALIRDGGQVGGGNPAVLTVVLLLEFLDAHVPRGLLRLGRGRTVVLLGSHTSRIDTRALNLHGHAVAAGGVWSRGSGGGVGPTPAPPESPESPGSYRASEGGLQGLPRGGRPPATFGGAAVVRERPR